MSGDPKECRRHALHFVPVARSGFLLQCTIDALTSKIGFGIFCLVSVGKELGKEASPCQAIPKSAVGTRCTSRDLLKPQQPQKQESITLSWLKHGSR